MFDFKNLNSAKNQAHGRDEKREQEADKAYNEAIDLLDKLNKSPDFDLGLLRQAADKILVSISNKRNKAEAYICLANIFYILDNVPAAIEHMKVAQSINPDLPEINKLQKLISFGQASAK
jgi:tetratricopeptide (TPR) repeat protein